MAPLSAAKASQLTAQAAKEAKRRAFFADAEDDGPQPLPPTQGSGDPAAAFDRPVKDVTPSRFVVDVDDLEVETDDIPANDDDHKSEPAVAGPVGFFNIYHGKDRVQILDTISTDGKDLLCYHSRMKCTLHLHSRALGPTAYVEATVRFLQQRQTRSKGVES